MINDREGRHRELWGILCFLMLAIDLYDVRKGMVRANGVVGGRHTLSFLLIGMAT